MLWYCSRASRPAMAFSDSRAVRALPRSAVRMRSSSRPALRATSVALYASLASSAFW